MFAPRGNLVSRVIDAVLVVVLLATAWRLVALRLGPVANSSESSVPLVERDVRWSVPDLDWSSHQRHVVLLVNPECLGCKISIPFYRELGELTRNLPGVQVVALAANRKAQVESWLAANRINVHRVIAIRDPARLGLVAFPTLLVVGADGVVTDFIQGQISDDVHTSVLARIQRPSSTASMNLTRRPIELKSASAEGREFLRQAAVIDIRDRSDYRTAAKAGTRNIPLDEISTRAAAEFSNRQSIAIHCAEGQLQRCRIAGSLLMEAGFNEVAILSASR